MSNIFDLIEKAIYYNGEYYWFTCGTHRAWYANDNGALLEVPRESGVGYDSFMCSADGTELDDAIFRLDRMVDDAIETGRLTTEESPTTSPRLRWRTSPNKTSELDAILDRVYGAGYEMAQLHSQGKGTTKRTLTSDTIYAAKKALAQREQAAELRGRIDELERIRRVDDMDDGDKHIEIEIYVVDRIGKLRRQATKPEKEG